MAEVTVVRSIPPATSTSSNQLIEAFVYALCARSCDRPSVNELEKQHTGAALHSSSLSVERRTSDEPDGQCRSVATTADLQPRPPNRWNGSGRACPNSQAVHWNSTAVYESESERSLSRRIAPLCGCWTSDWRWSSTRRPSSMLNTQQCALRVTAGDLAVMGYSRGWRC